jgi:ribonuclease-3
VDSSQIQEYRFLWERQPKARARLEALEERLGHRFARPELLVEALTHRSAVSELGESLGREIPLPWNERLEFLGDSVLGLAVSRRLMQREEAFDEGTLSRLRATIVNESTLADAARAADLGAALILGRSAEQGGGRGRDSLLADAFEAVIGAVYLDSGFERADALVGRLLADSLAGDLTAKSQGDSKTLLQEWTQERLKLAPSYETIRESGPDHDKRFEVVVRIAGEIYGRGVGVSKKRASQEAARMALQRLTTAPSRPSEGVSL